MQYRPRRVPCRTEVDLLGPDGRAALAVLRDVSLNGARLSGLSSLSRGDRVHLTVIGRGRGARVCWARGGAVGLLFDAPLAERELAALAGEAAQALGARGAASVGRRPAIRAPWRSAPPVGAKASDVDGETILSAIERALGTDFESCAAARAARPALSPLR